MAVSSHATDVTQYEKGLSEILTIIRRDEAEMILVLIYLIFSLGKGIVAGIGRPQGGTPDFLLITFPQINIDNVWASTRGPFLLDKSKVLFMYLHGPL